MRKISRVVIEKPVDRSACGTNIAMDVEHGEGVVVLERAPRARSPGCGRDIERSFPRRYPTLNVVVHWKQHANFFGQRIRVTVGSESVVGTAETIDNDGALQLRRDDGTRMRIIAGELSSG